MNASLIILALTVASFLLGFLRDLFIARAFGLSWQADLIFVALILPMFFENFLGLALRDAMIPYLQKLRSQSEALFAAVGRMLYWRVMALGVVVSVIIIAASHWHRSPAVSWCSASGRCWWRCRRCSIARVRCSTWTTSSYCR